MLPLSNFSFQELLIRVKVGPTHDVSLNLDSY